MSARAMRRRPHRRFAIVFSLTLVVALSSLLSRTADAALTDVAVSPDHGSGGTSVTVSGSACPPGLLINPSRAGVLILTLGVSIDVPVPANGSWSVEFMIPEGALVGPHAIVTTCTRDLVPLPYAPLTLTVEPPPVPPTTTIDAGPTTTTGIGPTTTMAGPTSTTSTASSTTNTVPLTAGGGEEPRTGSGPVSEPPGRAPTSTVAADNPDGTVATTATLGAATAGEHGIRAGRVAPDPRNRGLAFGPLSPIAGGWMGILLAALILIAFISALVAILWFRWLRHTRAREWWIRWHNQILRIRAHARPPA
jgi:hypothetical protein